MKPNKYVLFFIFLVVHCTVQSQYGYMGKKLTLQYSLSTFPCPVSGIYKNLVTPMPGLLLFESTNAVRRILVAQHLDLGFTVSRQWELTAMATVRPIKYAAYEVDDPLYNYKPQLTAIPVFETALDLCVRKYIRGASAPVGGYFYFGLGKSFAKTSIKEDSIRFTNYYSAQPDKVLPTFNSTWNATRFIYGMGIKKTFNNKFFYNVEGTLVLATSNSKSNDASPSSPTDQSIRYMDDVIHTQFISYQSFYAKVGFGAFIGKSSRLPKKT